MTACRRLPRTAVLCALLGLAASTAGCGGNDPPPAGSRGANASPDANASSDAGAPVRGASATPVTAGTVPERCADLHETILAVPPTRQAFSAEFGPPDSVRAGAEPNRHIPGATDSLFTVYYPGFVMDIRTPPNARDMATHVRAEDDRYLAYPGLGMGTTGNRLQEVLGTPTAGDDRALTWDCSAAVEQPVTFELAGGRVTAITIAYYVD